MNLDRALRRVLLALLLTGGTSWGVGNSLAATPRIPASATFPVSELKQGMTGVGYTVFAGTTIDTFSVAVLCVLHYYRSGFDLIMARASSPIVDKTGIIAGMSGSPVYINGRLIGAVSYTWSFLKEPMAGITPIDQMLSLLPVEGARLPDVEDTFGKLGAPDGAGDAGAAKPIATPISLAGFTSEALRYLEPWLSERGFVASPGGANEPGEPCDSLRPGSAVGVQLIRGDWSAAAIGTVTYRDKDRILAFC